VVGDVAVDEPDGGVVGIELDSDGVHNGGIGGKDKPAPRASKETG
jgi:hypothetical protein